MLLFEHKFKEYLTEAEEKGKIQKVLDKVESKYLKSNDEEVFLNDINNNKDLSDAANTFNDKILKGEDNIISAAYSIFSMGMEGVKKALGEKDFNTIDSYIKNKFKI